MIMHTKPKTMRKILTHILIIAFTMKSSVASCLDLDKYSHDSCLRPIASAISDIAFMGFAEDHGQLTAQRPNNPYHPENVLDTFKSMDLFPWSEIPDEYFWPDEAVFADELARLLGKDPLDLTADDYCHQRVFVIYSGKKKTLGGLIDLISRRNNLCTLGKAVDIKNEKLRTAKYIDIRYMPENILETFVKDDFSWERIPDEYLKPCLRVLLQELANILGKAISDLNVGDFSKKAFQRPKSAKKKITAGMLTFVARRHGLGGRKEGLVKALEIIGEKTTRWSNDDCGEVKRLLEPTVPGKLGQINSEKDLLTYLYINGLSKEQEFTLAYLIKNGRGNKAALSALMYAHLKTVELFVKIVSTKYRLDSADLMAYIIRRLEVATLSFNPGLSMYRTFQQKVMAVARYDYVRLEKSGRKKKSTTMRSYPRIDDEKDIGNVIAEPKKPIAFLSPESVYIFTEVCNVLWFSGRDIKIYLRRYADGLTQREISIETSLSRSSASAICSRINKKLSPYRKGLEKVLNGDMQLNTLLNRIRRDMELGVLAHEEGSTPQKSSSSGLLEPDEVARVLGTVIKGPPNHSVETLDIVSCTGQAPLSPPAIIFQRLAGMETIENRKVLAMIDNAA
ncbi:MAG: hypothetical protein ABH843_01860 [Candidatus Omnitrophota bacterium]